MKKYREVRITQGDEVYTGWIKNVIDYSSKETVYAIFSLPFKKEKSKPEFSLHDAFTTKVVVTDKSAEKGGGMPALTVGAIKFAVFFVYIIFKASAHTSPNSVSEKFYKDRGIIFSSPIPSIGDSLFKSSVFVPTDGFGKMGRGVVD